MLADTAGLRSHSNDLIEKEGISRALNLYEKSDLILVVVDTLKYENWGKNNKDKVFKDYLRHYLSDMKLNNLLKDINNTEILQKECLIIMNKTDLGSSEILETVGENLVKMSCKTEEGVSNLLANITEKLALL